MNRIFSILAVSLSVLLACNPVYRPGIVTYTNYRINAHGGSHDGILRLVESYGDSINKTMSKIIGQNQVMLKKNLKENSLGYFLSDAYLYMSREKLGRAVDVAFMNHGGIRLDELPPGEIKTGTIYELMPFDNLLMLQKMTGKQLRQYIDSLAAWGSVIQTGMTLSVSDKKPGHILVGGKPIEDDSEYTIAISDYLVNNTDMLKKIPAENTGYLQRDAIIDYIIMFTSQGKKIIVEHLNRVKYHE